MGSTTSTFFDGQFFSRTRRACRGATCRGFSDFRVPPQAMVGVGFGVLRLSLPRSGGMKPLRGVKGATSTALRSVVGYADPPGDRPLHWITSMTRIRLSVCWFDPLRVFISTLLAARCSLPGPAARYETWSNSATEPNRLCDVPVCVQQANPSPAWR